MALNSEHQRDSLAAQSDDPTARAKTLLNAWFDDDDARALADAIELCRKQPIDIDAVLSHVRDKGGTRPQAAVALREIRKAVGLPLIPGAPCRNAP